MPPSAQRAALACSHACARWMAVATHTVDALLVHIAALRLFLRLRAREHNSPELSNFGGCVTLWAPGQDIPSLALPHGVSTKSGSSMAAAFVAGAAAIYVASHPHATPTEITAALRREATRDQVTIARPRHQAVTTRDLLFVPSSWY